MRYVVACCIGVLFGGLAACGGKPAVVASPEAPAVSVPQTKQAVPTGQHATRIKAEPGLVVRLVGHTDDLGSRAYNLAIAEQRVNAVYGFLRRAGVPIRQLRRSGAAGDIAGKSCESTECRAKKRRVELVYPAP